MTTARAGSKKLHVSVSEHARAKRNFDAKYEVLEEIVRKKKWGEYPHKGHIVDFCDWEDEARGLEAVSRSILYDTLVDERKKADKLLEIIRVGRRQKTVRNDEVQQLTDRAEAAEKKAQAYVNQFVAVSKEANDLREEVTALRSENARLAKKIKEVSPIRGVAAKRSGKDALK